MAFSMLLQIISLSSFHVCAHSVQLSSPDRKLVNDVLL